MANRSRGWLRPRSLVRVSVASAAVAILLFGSVGSASAGSPPNRLDDNRGNGFTIAGEILINGLVRVLCPICAVDIGARVQDSPRVSNVYWDNNWNANNPMSPTTSQLDSMVSTLVGSDYLGHATQYDVHPGSFEGGHQDTTCGGRPSGNVGFGSLLAWITCEVQTPGTGVPFPDDNSLYSIFLPEGTTVSGAINATCQPGQSAAFHAWSAAFTIQFILFIPVPTIQGYPYTVVPSDCARGGVGGAVSVKNALDGFSELFGHELAEASIDPFPPTGWIDNSQFDINNLPQVFSTGEPADICQPSSTLVPTTPVRMRNGITVGTYWSNSDNACVPFGASFHLGETGLPGSITPTATLNGGSVGLPFDDNVETGSSESFSYPSPVSDGTPGTRWVTSDAGASLLTSGPFTDTANYGRQFFLTTGTQPVFLAGVDPSLTPSDWHADGSIVPLNTTDPIPTSPGDRYRFDHWSGDLFSIFNPASITMTSPKQAIASYVLQHRIDWTESGIPAAFPWHVTSLTTPTGLESNVLGPFFRWVDDSGFVDYTYESPVAGAAGVQYVLTSVSPAAPLASVTNPLTVSGNYKTQFRLTVQTTGLGANLTHIRNSGVELGTANDSTPLSVWIDSGTVLALDSDANVDGADGTQYFFQSFTPTPPGTMSAPFTTTASYKTLGQLIADALASGGISGPSAHGVGNALTQKFDVIQKHMGAHQYDPVLGELKAFVNSIKAQCCTPSNGKEITSSLAHTLELDAMLVYHNALCKGVGLGQIGVTPASNDYAYYSGLVSSLGGTVLPPC